MSPRDLAVYLLATLEEYAEIAGAEINFDDMPDGIADLLDKMLQDANTETVASLGEVQSVLYSNGTSPIIEFGDDKRFMRWVRLPGDPTEPTDKQRAQLARLNLEVVK